MTFVKFITEVINQTKINQSELSSRTQTLTTVHHGRQAREQLKHLKTVVTQMLALLALLQTDAFDC